MPVAEQLIQALDETGIDGFNLTRTVAPESHQDFIRLVIPELRRRGRYKTEYASGSLRDNCSIRATACRPAIPQSSSVYGVKTIRHP